MYSVGIFLGSKWQGPSLYSRPGLSKSFVPSLVVVVQVRQNRAVSESHHGGGAHQPLTQYPLHCQGTLFLTVFRCSSPPNSTLYSAESLASQQLPILVTSNKEFLSREANYVNHPTQHHRLGQSWVAPVYLPQSYLLPIAGRPRNTFDDAGSSDPPPMRGQFL